LGQLPALCSSDPKKLDLLAWCFSDCDLVVQAYFNFWTASQAHCVHLFPFSDGLSLPDSSPAA
jgi:hypothetical protein